MRLVNRLALSHGVLGMVLSAALAVTIFTLVDLYRQVRAVRESDLATIDEEEALYRAAWKVEVAARHGVDACELGATDAVVGATFREPERILRQAIQDNAAIASRPFATTAGRYLELVASLTRDKACQLLRSPESRAARLKLDEDLTDAWIARLYELHRRLEVHEEEIVRTGRRAILRGVGMGLLALVAGWVVASRVARGVTKPLAALSEAAQRVGKGEFAPFPTVDGPREVVELSSELDRMRVDLAALDALKQQFLASVSHELRTPLGKLREALALLEDGTAGHLDDKQLRILGIARRACEAEIRLVTTLLDLSRLRAGKVLQVDEPRPLDDVVREAIAAEQTDAGAQSVTIEFEPVGAGPRIALDGLLVERAIANVLRNAVSVSPAGGVVSVKRTVEPEGPLGRKGPHACITVQDEGPGVPPELRTAIFDAFTTHEVSGRPMRMGIGLGLTLVREIVEAHGGHVQLAAPGPGDTTFALFLPVGRGGA